MRKKQHQRVKTPGGMSSLPVTQDSANGSILEITRIISALGDIIQKQILDKQRYDDLGQTTSIAEALRKFLENINKVDEDEACALLMKIIGEMTTLEINIQRLTKRNKELEETDAHSWLKTSQNWATQKLTNEAEDHVLKLIEYIQDLYDRFEEKEGEYANLANEVKKEKEKLADEIMRLKQFFEDQEIDVKIFTALGNLQGLKKLIKSMPKITKQAQQDIAASFEKVANDFQFLVKIHEDIKKITAGVKDLNYKINFYREEETNKLRLDIENMKQQLQRIRIIFQITDHESYFWGLVPGIAEMVKYNPLDLLVYQLTFKPKDFLENDLKEYFETFERIKLEAEDILTQKCEEELQQKELEKKKEKAISGQSPVEQTPKKRTRRDELVEMFMATLWIFIFEKLNRAKMTGKNLGKRQGDFGKKPKVVANLLGQSDFIDKTEAVFVKKDLISILISKGLIEFRKDTSEEEMGEARAFVTSSGRNFCMELCQREVYANLMQKVWETHQTIIEYYRTRGSRR